MITFTTFKERRHQTLWAFMKKILKRIGYAILLILLVLTVATIWFVNFHPEFGGTPSDETITRMRATPHFVNNRFTNIHRVKEEFSWFDYKKMSTAMMKGNPRRVPPHPLPITTWTKEEVNNLTDTSTTAIWYGHSAFYLKIDGKNILLDPMFGDRPSPVPFMIKKRFNDTLPIAIPDLPPIDIIVFSHDHYDHLDYGSILKLKDKTKHFIVPLGVGAHLERWGVPKEKITELYWGESVEMAGIHFTCTPAQHFSGRGMGDKMKTLWSSWVIKGQHHKLFFSGDSGYFDGFKKIGDTYGPFDVCMMECGQYNELWKDIHMMPEETAQAHLDLKGKTLIPIHWGAFTLALHDWNDSVIRLSRAANEKGIDLAIPQIGEAIVIGQKKIYPKWWEF